MSLRFLVGIGLTATLVACGGDKDEDDTTTDEADTDTDTDSDSDADTDSDTDTDADADTDTGMPMAAVRVMHLGVDAPAVDVFVDDATPAAVSNLAFTQGTGYLDLPAAAYNFKVSPTGTTPGDAVLDESFTLGPNMNYAAVAHGFLGDSTLALTAFVEDWNGIPAGNNRLHIVHAASLAPDVDIWLLGATPTMLLDDVPYGADANVDAVAGALSVGLDIDEDMVPDLVFDVPDLGLSDELISVYAVNNSTDPLDVVLVAHLPDGSTAQIDPTPQTASVRVLHLGVDAPAVDVFVDDATPAAVSNLAFKEGTGYLDLPAATYNFKVSVTGAAPQDAVLDESFSLRAGMNYAAVAHGFLAGSTLALDAFVEDWNGIPAGNNRLHIVHAASLAPEVDIWLLGATPTLLLDDVPYGVDGNVDAPAGALSVGLDINEDAIPDLVFDVPDVGLSDELISVYAVNDSAIPLNVVLIAHLPDGSTAQVDPN